MYYKCRSLNLSLSLSLSLFWFSRKVIVYLILIRIQKNEIIICKHIPINIIDQNDNFHQIHKLIFHEINSSNLDSVCFIRRQFL